MKKSIFLAVMCALCTLAYSQSWNINGNSGTNATNSFIGTTGNVAFKIRNNIAVRITVNGTGKVSIGTASPITKFHLNGTGTIAIFGNATTVANYNYWYSGNEGGGGYLEQRGNANTPGSDILRIASSKSGKIMDYAKFNIDPDNGFSFVSIGSENGNVGIETYSPAYKFTVTATPAFANPVAFIENINASNAPDGLYINAGSNTQGGTYFISFRRPGGNSIGSVNQTTATGVNNLTISDKRLKNIIGTTPKGLPDLMKIKIYDYTFNSDLQQQVLIGFVAQEFYDVFPQSVSKPRDTIKPAEKNPWMVDYASVI